MKHLITRTLTSLALAVVGLAVAAPAQITHTTKATIPFEFTVGTRTFPAGDYFVSTPEQGLLAVRDERGHMVAQVLSVGIESNDPNGQAKLNFEKADGQYILSEVWNGTDTGEEVLRAKSQALFLRRHTTESRAAAEGSQP